MRVRLKHLFALALLITAIFVSWAAIKTMMGRGPRPSASENARHQSNEDASIAFVPDRGNALEFVLPRNQQRLRIMTNAAIAAPEAFNDPENLWLYAIRCEFLAGDTVVDVRTLHFQETADTIRSSLESSKRFSGSALVPLSTRVRTLDLRGITVPPDRMRVSITKLDANLAEVVVRLLVARPTPERKLGFFWDRLSRSTQRRLARGNVHDPELISKQERRNLLINYWQPVAPTGLPGSDYHLRELTVGQDRNISAQTIEAAPIDGESATITFSIPPERRVEFLRVVPVLGAGTLDRGTIVLEWFGEERTERSREHLTWLGAALETQCSFAPGLLQITLPLGAGIELFDDTGERVEQSETFLPGALVTRDQAVVYNIFHPDEQPIPFRFDLRQLLPAEYGNGGDAVVFLELVGARREYFEVSVGNVPSLHERLADSDDQEFVSDPRRFYIEVPQDIYQLNITATSPVLLTAANRPSDMVRLRRLPQIAAPGTIAQRDWFLVYPDNHHELEKEGRWRIIRVQRRSPDDLESPNFGLTPDWVSLRPQHDWIGRSVLEQLKPGRDPVADAYMYTELDPGQPFLFRRQRGADGLLLAETNLIYSCRAQSGPVSLAIEIDRDLQHIRVPAGISQTPISSIEGRETGRIKVAPDRPCRVFVSGLDIDGRAASHRTRLTNRLEDQPVTLIFTKFTNKKETLTVDWYAPRPCSQDLKLDVSIEGPPRRLGPSDDWTFRHSRYVVTAAEGDPLPVLDSAHDEVSRPQRFFISLGADLKPAEYSVRLTPTAGARGLVVYSRVLPAAVESRRVSTILPLLVDGGENE